jgi:putative ABC transport system permease protein
MEFTPQQPPLLGRLLLRLSRLGARRPDVQADLHELFEARLAAQGRRAAARGFLRDVVSLWRWPVGAWVRDVFADVKQGLRLMRRGPAFTVTAAVVLSLGIGVNTALFSGIAGLFFKPLPVEDPDSLFYLYTKNHAGQVMAHVDPQFFAEFSERGAALADFTGHWRVGMRLTADNLTEVAYGEFVAANYFALLGVEAARGRTLEDGDDDLTTPGMAVVLSHDMWIRRFGGRTDIVGTQVRIHASDGTVVGVAEPGFEGLTDPWTPTQFWVPGLKMQSAGSGGRAPAYQRQYVGGPVGRLKPGVSFEQYQSFFNSIVPEWTAAKIDRARGYSKTAADFERSRRIFEATSYPLYRATDVRMPFNPEGQVIPAGLLAGMVTVVALVLLIAASNIAGLLLARGVARTGEVAVRRALGAGVGRLSRQLLAESVLLATAGGALGLFVAYTLVGLFRAYTPARFAVEITLDWRVLIFALCVCVGAGVLVGLAPALQAARVNVLEALGNGIGATRRVRARLRHWIVIPQIALTMVLLLVAAVHTRTLLQIERADPGYRTDGAVVMTVGRWEPAPVPGRDTQDDQNTHAAKMRQFNRDVVTRVGQVPQVAAFALAGMLPVTESLADLQSVVTYEDYVSQAPPRGSAERVLISDGYFDVMGMRLRDGRMFDERDGPYESFGPRVAIVSEALARAVWPAGNAVGRTFTLQTESPGQKVDWLEVVGVVNDVEPVFNERGHRPRVYVPVKQQWRGDAQYLVVRGAGDQDALIRDVKAAVVGVEPFAEVSQVRTMEQVVGEILYPRRLAAAMLVAGALIGLVLSCIGLYGVVSYSVAQRQREIGIRATLGAERRDIAALVLKEGVRVAAIGTTAGFVVAVLLLRVTAGMLPQLPTADIVSFIVVPLILAAMVVLACLVPAWRAARVDPAAVLRT